MFLYFVQSQWKLEISRVVLVAYGFLMVLVSQDPIFLLAGALLLVVAEIDRREFRIPDVITKPGIFALVIWFHANHQLLLLAGIWFAFMYLITAALPKFLGRGDVKLFGFLLLSNGYFHAAPDLNFLLSLIFLASLFALPEALFTKVRARTAHFPFGPSIGAAWIVLVGAAIS